MRPADLYTAEHAVLLLDAVGPGGRQPGGEVGCELLDGAEDELDGVAGGAVGQLQVGAVESSVVGGQRYLVGYVFLLLCWVCGVCGVGLINGACVGWNSYLSFLNQQGVDPSVAEKAEKKVEEILD